MVQTIPSPYCLTHMIQSKWSHSNGSDDTQSLLSHPYDSVKIISFEWFRWYPVLIVSPIWFSQNDLIQMVQMIPSPYCLTHMVQSKLFQTNGSDDTQSLLSHPYGSVKMISFKWFRWYPVLIVSPIWFSQNDLIQMVQTIPSPYCLTHMVQSKLSHSNGSDDTQSLLSHPYDSVKIITFKWFRWYPVLIVSPIWFSQNYLIQMVQTIPSPYCLTHMILSKRSHSNGSDDTQSLLSHPYGSVKIISFKWFRQYPVLIVSPIWFSQNYLIQMVQTIPSPYCLTHMIQSKWSHSNGSDDTQSLLSHPYGSVKIISIKWFRWYPVLIVSPIWFSQNYLIQMVQTIPSPYCLTHMIQSKWSHSNGSDDTQSLLSHPYDSVKMISFKWFRWYPVLIVSPIWFSQNDLIQMVQMIPSPYCLTHMVQSKLFQTNGSDDTQSLLSHPYGSVKIISIKWFRWYPVLIVSPIWFSQNYFNQMVQMIPSLYCLIHIIQSKWSHSNGSDDTQSLLSHPYGSVKIISFKWFRWYPVLIVSPIWFSQNDLIQMVQMIPSPYCLTHMVQSKWSHSNGSDDTQSLLSHPYGSVKIISFKWFRRYPVLIDSPIWFSQNDLIQMVQMIPSPYCLSHMVQSKLFQSNGSDDTQSLLSHPYGSVKIISIKWFRWYPVLIVSPIWFSQNYFIQMVQMIPSLYCLAHMVQSKVSQSIIQMIPSPCWFAYIVQMILRLKCLAWVHILQSQKCLAQMVQMILSKNYCTGLRWYPVLSVSLKWFSWYSDNSVSPR